MICVHKAAYKVLMMSNASQKCMAMRELYHAWKNKEFIFSDGQTSIEKVIDAGRPVKPTLVSPKTLAKRSLHTPDGRVVFMHAIAHIEFNAINLALDAVYRFRNQPEDFYSDWLKVADDEARHFVLVRDYLQSHQSDYGDYVAHNGLWEMVVKTDHDILHRMALVPRVLEARGLDVSPMMIKKLEQAGDLEAAEILTVIYQDEIKHVEAGSRWFNYHCDKLDLDAEKTFIDIVNCYMKGKLKGPFNEKARLIAGFKETELAMLNAMEG